MMDCVKWAVRCDVGAVFCVNRACEELPVLLGFIVLKLRQKPRMRRKRIVGTQLDIRLSLRLSRQKNVRKNLWQQGVSWRIDRALCHRIRGQILHRLVLMAGGAAKRRHDGLMLCLK